MDFFPGALDEVQTDQWVVPDDEIARRATWPAPATGQLGRFLNAAGEHYTAPTSEPVREGYHFEGLLGRPVLAAHPNTHLLYGCREGTDYFTSKDAACDGKTVVGELGRVYSKQPTNLATVAMYSCSIRYRAGRLPVGLNCEGAANPGVLLGYTVAYGSLTRYWFTYDHWVSAGATRPGYKFEGSLGLLALAEEPGTQQLWSCLDDGDQFVSLDPACEGKTVQSTSGRVWTAAPAGLASRQIYRCLIGTQRFVSVMANCEGQTLDRSLGYVLTAAPATTPVFE